MKTSLMFTFILMAACALSPFSQSKEKKMNRMWEEQLTKDEVLKIYGLAFQTVPNGIIYSREDSKIPKYAFFFDHNNVVTDQFAMLDKDDLKKFKSLNKCEWDESEQIKSHSDHTRHNPVGLCKSRRLKYEFKSDFGLFEVSQIK